MLFVRGVGSERELRGAAGREMEGAPITTVSQRPSTSQAYDTSIQFSDVKRSGANDRAQIIGCRQATVPELPFQRCTRLQRR